MERAYYIAEIGLNHNGDVKLAKQLIDMAIECGANAVKFQKRCVEQMATKDVLDMPYDKFPEWGKTYREVREHLELSKSEYVYLRNYCKDKIDFIVTPFDLQSLEFIEDLNVNAIKIASHSLTDIPLLEAIAKKKKTIILSTGMSSWHDIDIAVSILDNTLERVGSDHPLVLLHCVSNYPTNSKYANLRMIMKIKMRYTNYVVGLSDHNNSIVIPAVARSFDAMVFERHITLDKSMIGYDHSFSLNKKELKDVIRGIRETEDALDYYDKTGPQPWEMDAFKNYRRSIVSAKDIKKGTTITKNMLTTKAPNIGLSPVSMYSIIGKKMKVNIKKDTHITGDMIYD